MSEIGELSEPSELAGVGESGELSELAGVGESGELRELTATREPSNPRDPAGRELTADPAGSAAPRRRKPRDKPLVMVITGTGKGKSTSAFGMLLRAWARGYRCGVFQFVKSGKWKVGEAKAAAQLGGIDWEKMGDGWSWLSRDLTESADLAREGWTHVKALIAAERYEFLVLDEITYPIKWGWIDVDDVVTTLRERPGFQHVVITGRDAAPELIALADLVSEVTKLKHPMDAGIRAQQGIEW